MITVLTYPNLELTPFSINNTTDVNPYPMDDVEVQLVNGELMIYMRGHVGPLGQLPGALVGFTLPVVGSALGKPMSYAGMNHEMKIDETSNALLECWECDLKWCTQAAAGPSSPIPNIVDGSCQKVYSKGGMWQIDDKTPTWVDTGFKPGKFTANQWNKVSTRMTTGAGKFSMISITDGTTYSIPSSYNGIQIQNLPLLTTNWTATGVQFQLALSKSGFAVVWLRNVSVSFSDAPIP